MAQITEKELSAISDLLSIEQNLVAKYRAYASIATDNALKDQYEAIAARHQHHYDELYANLK